MYKLVHNLVNFDRSALITVNSVSMARDSLLKLYKPSSLSSIRYSDTSMFGIIYQKRPDLVHLYQHLKTVLHLTI